MENCELKHGLLKQEIDTNASHIKELQKAKDAQEGRITKLEIADGEIFAKIENLISSVKSLVGWIKGLIVALLTALLGFFFWYVQTIGR